MSASQSSAQETHESGSSSSSSLKWKLRNFSLESYIQDLSGQAKVRRLIHIARTVSKLGNGKGDSPEEKQQVREKALKLAIEYAQNEGQNTELYQRLCEEANVQPDYEWIEQEKQKLAQQQATLEREVNSSMADQSREDIRQSLRSLGKLCESYGDTEKAIRNYSRATEYCTKHFIPQMYLNIAYAAFLGDQWDIVVDYANKALRMTQDSNDKNLKNECNVLLALGHFVRRQDEQTINSLCRIETEKGEELSHIISIAELAGLLIITSLVTQPRSFLQEHLLKDKQLQRMVETAPRLKEVVKNFLDADYGAALRSWNDAEPSLLLDLFLSNHVPRFSQGLLERCVCDYVTPYETVVISQMSSDFGMNERQLKHNIINLIQRGVINVKVDEKEGLLVKTSLSEQENCWKAASTTAESFNRKAHETMFSLNLRRRGFFQKKRKTGLGFDPEDIDTAMM
eukprot:gb/GECG01012798.1/.p1 GENE.gb/GECG01012798.1/~~gb/GECG01012798.1/.p1  ORF type:complete len:456 (+),score=66.94 gb/GECG01012798.1/:1-1368(+)